MKMPFIAAMCMTVAVISWNYEIFMNFIFFFLESHPLREY